LADLTTTLSYLVAKELWTREGLVIVLKINWHPLNSPRLGRGLEEGERYQI